MTTLPKPSAIERALRDLGLSRRQAKAFMRGGLPAVGVDVPEDPPEDDAKDDGVLVAQLRAMAAVLRGEKR